jgi:hypothetical protein
MRNRRRECGMRQHAGGSYEGNEQGGDCGAQAALTDQWHRGLFQVDERAARENLPPGNLPWK